MDTEKTKCHIFPFKVKKIVGEGEEGDGQHFYFFKAPNKHPIQSSQEIMLYF